MKKDELTKLGLDEATAQKIADASAEELKGFVPLARLNEVITERDTARNDLKDRDNQIEKLKGAGDVETLKKQIEALQADNKKKDEVHADEIRTLKIDNAVSAALTAAKAKNVKAARALLDLTKAELAEDGTVKGLSEQIEKLKKADDSKFMFDAETKPKFKGAKTGENGSEEGEGGVDTSKMTYTELCAYLSENPDAKL